MHPRKKGRPLDEADAISRADFSSPEERGKLVAALRRLYATPSQAGSLAVQSVRLVSEGVWSGILEAGPSSACFLAGSDPSGLIVRFLALKNEHPGKAKVLCFLTSDATAATDFANLWQSASGMCLSDFSLSCFSFAFVRK